MLVEHGAPRSAVSGDVNVDRAMIVCDQFITVLTMACLGSSRLCARVQEKILCQFTQAIPLRRKAVTLVKIKPHGFQLSRSLVQSCQVRFSFLQISRVLELWKRSMNYFSAFWMKIEQVFSHQFERDYLYSRCELYSHWLHKRYWMYGYGYIISYYRSWVSIFYFGCHSLLNVWWLTWCHRKLTMVWCVTQN